MIKYYKFDEEYQNCTDEEIEELYSVESSNLGDPYYYKAFKLVDCEPDKFCVINNTDLTREEWKDLFEYINSHKVNEGVSHADWSSGIPYYGLTDQFYIHTDNDNYYNIVYGYDYGFEWMYSSEDFIKEYAKSIDSDVSIADNKIDFVCE